MAIEPEIFWTSRFQSNYERYNGQRARIRARVNELRRKMQDEPTTWLRNMEKLQDPVASIYRDKVSEGDRLIFSPTDGLLLVDVGPHEVMEEFQALGNQKRRDILADKTTVPEWFLSEFKSETPVTNPLSQTSNLTEFDNSEMRWLYEEELNEAWLQFLDTQQTNLKDKIFNELKLPGDFEFHLILGGAGTGKTVVLLNLALSLASAGRNVICQFNEQVIKYLNSGKQRVPGAGLAMQQGAVVLLDDPMNFAILRQKLAEARKCEVRALVVALDPFQWVERRVYEKFDELIEISQPIQHNLDVCYRQSKVVGQQAIDYTKSILDKTSPFIIDSKIADHKKQLDPLKKICVDSVSFVDSGGRFKLYQSELNVCFDKEFERFLARDDKWTHWHPMLIIFDPAGTSMPSSWIEKIKGNNVLYKSLNQVDKIRGSEFQEIFVLLGEKTWQRLQEGVLGAGAVDWEKLLGLHTVLTRSKDATIVFVSGPDSGL
jgi:Txe/YoeB family toxin of Txe-Axe toxin-antitoxin module